MNCHKPINNPTPSLNDEFGHAVAMTPNGDLLVGVAFDDAGALNAGSAYLFDGNTGNLLLTINNPTPAHNDRFGVSVATTPSGDLLVGANYDDTGATEAGSAYLFDGTIVFSQPAPTIISLGVDDPDNLDDIYSRSDTITVTFDSDTNEPGGTSVQRKPVIDDMFTFTESLGRAYSGKWIAPDTFVITVKSVNNAGPPIISGTTVTPAGTTPILSIDETSDASSVTSPVLSGDFGITP